MRLIKPVVEIIHDTLDSIVNIGDIAVDATAGNGHDTLKLAELVGDEGHVYAFDIQEVALRNTDERLANVGLSHRVTLFQMDHSEMDMVLTKEVSVVVFNLGYLPGGNHEITTNPQSTVAALEKSFSLLKPGGVILIGLYWGHPGGELERSSIEKWVAELSADECDAMITAFPNRRKAPMVITLQKK